LPLEDLSFSPGVVVGMVVTVKDCRGFSLPIGAKEESGDPQPLSRVERDLLDGEAESLLAPVHLRGKRSARERLPQRPNQRPAKPRRIAANPSVPRHPAVSTQRSSPRQDNGLLTGPRESGRPGPG